MAVALTLALMAGLQLCEARSVAAADAADADTPLQAPRARRSFVNNMLNNPLFMGKLAKVFREVLPQDNAPTLNREVFDMERLDELLRLE